MTARSRINIISDAATILYFDKDYEDFKDDLIIIGKSIISSSNISSDVLLPKATNIKE